MKFRYVLDTDVVVAAMRSNQGASRQLLLAALDGHFKLLLSVALILEYEAVLTRPAQLAACGISKAEAGRVLDDLASIAEPIKIKFRWRSHLPDPGDDLVLEAALNGNADAIVTFNLRHFKIVEKSFDCAVLLPRLALQQVRS